ncbi:MAG: hypothetical protein AAF467_17180 [Actinomycetota bacterium]
MPAPLIVMLFLFGTGPLIVAAVALALALEDVQLTIAMTAIGLFFLTSGVVSTRIGRAATSRMRDLAEVGQVTTGTVLATGKIQVTRTPQHTATYRYEVNGVVHEGYATWYAGLFGSGADHVGAGHWVLYRPEHPAESMLWPPH